MNKLIREYQLRYNLKDCPEAGREIWRWKDEFVTHTGMPVGANIWTGEIMVVHNMIGRGVILESISAFSAGKKWHFTGSPCGPKEIVLERAFEEIGQSYNIFQNCQAFTAYCRTGIGKSKAVKNITYGLVAGGVTAALTSKNKNVRAIGILAAVIGGFGILADIAEEQKRIRSRIIRKTNTNPNVFIKADLFDIPKPKIRKDLFK
jgi:hypothetical protein